MDRTSIIAITVTLAAFASQGVNEGAVFEAEIRGNTAVIKVGNRHITIKHGEWRQATDEEIQDFEVRENTEAVAAEEIDNGSVATEPADAGTEPKDTDAPIPNTGVGGPQPGSNNEALTDAAQKAAEEIDNSSLAKDINEALTTGSEPEATWDADANAYVDKDGDIVQPETDTERARRGLPSIQDEFNSKPQAEQIDATVTGGETEKSEPTIEEDHSVPESGGTTVETPTTDETDETEETDDAQAVEDKADFEAQKEAEEQFAREQDAKDALEGATEAATSDGTPEETPADDEDL